jgi:hypothetical protein
VVVVGSVVVVVAGEVVAVVATGAGGVGGWGTRPRRLEPVVVA